MANGVPDISPEAFEKLLAQVGSIGTWLQAIGILAVLWLIWNIINFIISRKNRNSIKKLQEELERIESKIDALLKKK